MAEIKIAMVIVGTINGMAVNSARNTLNQAGDIFNPTGDVAESLSVLNQAMFVYEWVNYAFAGVGAGLLAKQGLVSAWTVIGPKLPKAFDTLSRINPAKIVKASLGQLRAQARLQSLRFSSLGQQRAMIGNYSRDGIAGHSYDAFAESLDADMFYVDPALWKALSVAQRDGLNMGVLDRFVLEGRTILVSTPQSLMRLIDKSGGPSSLAKELNHFLNKHGLVLSHDGTRMVPKGEVF